MPNKFTGELKEAILAGVNGSNRQGMAGLRGVEHQQKGDNPRRDVLAKRQLDHDGRFEQSMEKAPRTYPRPCELDARSCPASRWGRILRAGGGPRRSSSHLLK